MATPSKRERVRLRGKLSARERQAIEFCKRLSFGFRLLRQGRGHVTHEEITIAAIMELRQYFGDRVRQICPSCGKPINKSEWRPHAIECKWLRRDVEDKSCPR
jgi:hypothetical protein